MRIKVERLRGALSPLVGVLILALVAPIIQAPTASALEKAVDLRKTDPNPERSDTVGKSAKKPG
jgi:hypothetical protein